MARETMKLVANNKKAYHDFFIDDKYEAGIELHGTEVKSLPAGRPGCPPDRCYQEGNGREGSSH